MVEDTSFALAAAFQVKICLRLFHFSLLRQWEKPPSLFSALLSGAFSVALTLLLSSKRCGEAAAAIRENSQDKREAEERT